jgi:hypothetical protein
MIIVIFVISFVHGGGRRHFWCLFTQTSPGPSVWDAKILSVTKLDQISFIARFVPNIQLNEAFLVVGAVGLAFNILVR